MDTSTSDPLAAYLSFSKFIDWEDEGYVDRALAFANKVRPGLGYLQDKLVNNLTDESTDEEIQYWFYEAGKLDFADELRTWFRVLYQIFLKQDSGGRFGFLVICLSRRHFIDCIANVLDNKVLDQWGWVGTKFEINNEDMHVDLNTGDMVKITNHFNSNIVGKIGKVVEITPHSVWIVDSNNTLYFSFATNLEVLN